MNRFSKWKNYLPVIAVFLLCLIVRVYYISDKEGLDGDEHITMSLAYDVVGWGAKSYSPNVVYSADELRKILYVDDVGGFDGYVKDMKSLWLNNRDYSHASLYYMLLRTIFIGHDSSELAPVIWRGCGLNLLLFAVSFLCLYLLLNRLFRGRQYIIAGILLFACFNPLSISTTLLLREYQLAECLMSAFALAAVWLGSKIYDGENVYSVRTLLGISILIALLMSAGYFNAFMVLMVCCYVFYRSLKKYGCKYLPFFAVVGVLSIVLCCLMYRGYFNFITDVRTGEVVDKMGGSGIISNLYYSAGGFVHIVKDNLLGILLCAWIAMAVLYSIVKKKKVGCMKEAWIFVLAVSWCGLVLLLSTWKLTRYIAPCVPLAMSLVGYYTIVLTINVSKRVLAVPFVLLLVFVVSGDGIEYLKKRNDIYFPQAKRLLLYATYDDDRNSISQLTPLMEDSQECLIIDDTTYIATKSLPVDSTIYVFADKQVDILSHVSGYRSKIPFNAWIDIYEFGK